MAVLTNMARAFKSRPSVLPEKPPGVGYVASRLVPGIHIDSDSGMTVSAAYRAVLITTGTIAALPLHVYQKGPTGRQLAQDDSNRAIWDVPNAEVERMAFWETLIGHEVSNGNAFIWPEKNDSGQVVHLWPIDPRRVQVGRTSAGKKIYRIDGWIDETDYREGGNVLHIMGFSNDGLRGLSPIALHVNALALAKASEQYGSRLFAANGQVDSILSTDQPLSAEQSDEIYESWMEQRAGGPNGEARTMAVVGRGVKWTPVAWNPQDTQMLETRKFQVVEIARIFGVPPHLLGDVERSTSWGSGIEEQSRGFVQYTLLPHIVRFEQAISRALLPDGQYAKFEINGLLRGSALQQAQFISQLRASSIITPNQGREYLEMDRIDDPAADELTMPLNMAPLSTFQASDGAPTATAG